MIDQLPTPVLAEGERPLAVEDIIELRVHYTGALSMKTTVIIGRRGEHSRSLLVDGKQRHDLVLNAFLNEVERQEYATRVARIFDFGVRREWKDENRDWFHLTPRRG